MQRNKYVSFRRCGVVVARYVCMCKRGIRTFTEEKMRITHKEEQYIPVRNLDLISSANNTVYTLTKNMITKKIKIYLYYL